MFRLLKFLEARMKLILSLTILIWRLQAAVAGNSVVDDGALDFGRA